MSMTLARNFEGRGDFDFAEEVRRLSATASPGKKHDFVYIVPTRRRVRELQRDLVSNVTFGKIPVYTLELFAHELFLLLSTGRRVISVSMQGMIISEILSEGDFRFFRYSSARPGARRGVAPVGTIKKIVDQIGYLKENGITPDDYALMASSAESHEKMKLDEFQKIFAAYEDRLGGRMTDSAGMISVVNSEPRRLREAIETRFPGRMTAFVEGFYNFKKPELEFLWIISSNRDHSFLVKLDCDESNENLFRTMIATSKELRARGFRLRSQGRDAASLVGSSTGEFMAAHLFADRQVTPKRNLKDSVFVAGLKDNLGEAEFVAEKIREIMRGDPNQELSRICVASYLPQNYSRLFREVFSKYRIPANITDRYTLESNSAVNAVLSFVDVKASDFERVALLRGVTNRLISVSDKYLPDRAGSIIYNASLICRFERGLRGFNDAISNRMAVLSNPAFADSESDFNRGAREIETLRNAREVLTSIEQLLSPFNGELAPDEFRLRLRTLVSRLRLRENIARLNLEGVAAEIIERDSRALSAFLDVVDEVAGIEKERGGERMPAALWLENLRAALSMTRYNVRQKYGYGIYVTSLEEMRGLEFDHLFIVGMNEGELPARYNPEIFLPLRVQGENRETEPFLQRHLFYQAVSSFRKTLHLVYPTRRTEVVLMRSSFIDALTSIADVTFLDNSEAEASVVNIYNVHQLAEADSGLPGLREKMLGMPAVARLVPPNLERCRHAEAARFRNDTESEFAGKITDDELLSLLAGKLDGKEFSASQLESLAQCGFQYFVRRILGVDTVSEIETSLSALEKGAVLHDILYKFYSSLAELGRLNNARNEEDLLVEIARETMNRLNVSSEGTFGRDLFEIERDTMIGTENVPGTLPLFLRKVQAALSESGFTPEHFEVGFGMKGGDNEKTFEAVELGGVKVRGKIDRIDSNDNGLIVFDYKTSSMNPSHREVVRDMINPQLVIYLAALTKLDGLNQPDGRKVNPAGAAFISINREKLLKEEDGDELIKFIVSEEEGELRFNKKFRSTRWKSAPDEYPKSVGELIQRTEEFVGKTVEVAKSGRFNLTRFSPDKICRYCPYDEACRISLTREVSEKENSA